MNAGERRCALGHEFFPKPDSRSERGPLGVFKKLTFLKKNNHVKIIVRLKDLDFSAKVTNYLKNAFVWISVASVFLGFLCCNPN